jgi:hypothetical protein
VGAVVETTSARLKADPSQGSHFFHNITTLGINYITVRDGGQDFLDWAQVTALPVISETPFVAHARVDQPFTLKVDGKTSRCVIWFSENPC